MPYGVGLTNFWKGKIASLVIIINYLLSFGKLKYCSLYYKYEYETNLLYSEPCDHNQPNDQLNWTILMNGLYHVLSGWRLSVRNQKQWPFLLDICPGIRVTDLVWGFIGWNFLKGFDGRALFGIFKFFQNMNERIWYSTVKQKKEKKEKNSSNCFLDPMNLISPETK